MSSVFLTSDSPVNSAFVLATPPLLLHIVLKGIAGADQEKNEACANPTELGVFKIKKKTF